MRQQPIGTGSAMEYDKQSGIDLTRQRMRDGHQRFQATRGRADNDYPIGICHTLSRGKWKAKRNSVVCAKA
jgi:hypothetical protein